MKKITFILLLFTISFVACKKSEDSITYTQEQLNGTWENIVKDSEGCANQLIITASSLEESTVCTGSTATITYDSYSFDGRNMKVKLFGLNATYKINQLTETKLVATQTVLGQSVTAEYKRVK